MHYINLLFTYLLTISVYNVHVAFNKYTGAIVIVMITIMLTVTLPSEVV